MDVARLANVSQATVSYVLRGRTDKAISDETRERVLRAASKLGYMPNRLADGILRGKTSTIGVLMPDFAHSFNSQILMGLEETFAEAGYRTLIAHNRNNPDHEQHQAKMLLEHRVEGIVAVTDEQTIEAIEGWISVTLRMGVPVVVVDDTKLEGVVDTVVSDDIAGARMAIEHLVQQGHRRIAYLGGGDRASTARERRKGYEAVLWSYGIAVDPGLEVGGAYVRQDDPDLTPLFGVEPRPTAVFAVSDGLASRAMLQLAEHGVRVPDDLAFVGYGNLEWARYIGLSTVDQKPKNMGRHAALRLLERLNGEDEPPVIERLLPELLVRRSSENRYVEQ